MALAQGERKIPTFKSLLVGDSGVGKTALVRRLVHEDLEEVHPAGQAVTLDFVTNQGAVGFNVVESGGQVNLQAPEYADGCIIMCDVTSVLTFKNVPIWQKSIMTNFPGIPLVICGNKADLRRKVKVKHIRQLTGAVPYFEISTRMNYNCGQPFLYLARHLLKDEALQFFEDPALVGI